MESGKRARCLGCGLCGPVQEEAQEAKLALKDEAPSRQRGRET